MAFKEALATRERAKIVIYRFAGRIFLMISQQNACKFVHI